MRAFAQSIVETVRQPLLVLDRELRVCTGNAAFYRTFGVAPSETEGRLVYEGDHWDIPGLRSVLEKVVQDGGFVEDFEVHHDFPRAGVKVMRLDARCVVGDNGTPMVLLAFEDNTDRLLAREKLQQLNGQLEDRVRERTAQLEASNQELEAFSYSVSHDLRAPLRALDGFSDELLRCYPGQVLDEKGQHYLRRIRSGTQRMGQLIDDMLQLSRLNRGEVKRERVDLTALADAMAAELKSRESARDVTFAIEPNLTATGDESLLRVVLENLLGNAWKFTSKKPAAAIAFGRDEREGRPFFVRDDGAGFDMAHSDKLFGAFQRLHSQREFPGHGVGLATVQRIVHRHGGQVWAEGVPGRGATFHFTLPQEESV